MATSDRSTAQAAAGSVLTATPKVSVVVPTYAPGKRIQRLVSSLEAQTMPTDDFEVIFVDDGSPDRTWEQLQQIQASHPNVTIERIENSGWPSRPRNVGLELARGEYVLFMDHDDELYPRALEAGYAMAARTRADVLNGKETRTDQSKWALEVYATDVDNAIHRQDIHPLIPTNPHKLFRRALLMEHGIRFPEGRRVLWEDVFFCIDVARHAEVISVLADTPFYHWVRGGETASSSYSRDRYEYWRWVRQIVLRTNEVLGGVPGLEDQWRLMLLHQYRSRVLTAVGSPLFKAPAAEQEMVRETVDELIRDHLPDTLDAWLTPTQRGRADLLRRGRWDLLRDYVGVDAGLLGISTATSVGWAAGRLEIGATSRWTASGGRPLAVRADGAGFVRDLPPEVAEELSAGALDMTATLEQARTSMAVRARDTAVTWMLPGSCASRVEVTDGRPELVVTATAVLDPATAVFGRPLDETSWDVTARNELLGAINQRGLRTSLPPQVAVHAGHVYVAYRNKTGMLSLDVDQRNRSLTGSAPLEPERATSWSTPERGLRRWVGRGVRRRYFELPFSGVATCDETAIDGHVLAGAGSDRPARIVTRPDGAWLCSSVEQVPGTYRMRLRFHGRDLDAGVDVTVGTDGELTFARHRA